MSEANSQYLDEARAVALVRELAGPAPEGLVVGIGDDCAVLRRPGFPLSITADAMVEGVHFRGDLMTPAQIGHRVMAANLSDLAAMGARPRWGFLSLGLKPPVAERFLRELLGGLITCGRRHGLHLAGGDMVKSPQTMLNLTLVGENTSAPLLRSQAQAGDLVCVSGFLGSAGAGLNWLLAGRPAQGAPGPTAAYRTPTPRVELGLALAESGLVNAMMDLSDGIAPDLARLAAAAGLGAVLEAAKLPIAPDTSQAALELGLSPLELALAGGEDFELLFTCRPENLAPLTGLAAKLEGGGLTITPVGFMVEGKGLALQTEAGTRSLRQGGFDHFGA